MPVLAALATSLILFGAARAIGKIFAPNCTDSSLNWSFNTLNQNPCQVAAYLGTTCHNDTVTIPPLPSGSSYVGPLRDPDDAGDLCKCNTITYSLMSACGACQGDVLWIPWGEWVDNCTTILPSSSFPNPVPNGTFVPQWALRDVTHDSFGLWDDILAKTIGDSPEISPGVLINGSSSTTTSPPGTITPSPTGFPDVTSSFPSLSTAAPSGSSSSGGGDSNTGAIVGGVVGGVALIAIALIGTFYLRSRRPKAPSAAFIIDAPSRPYNEPRKPLSVDRTPTSSSTHQTPISPMRVYNPNDPTTFPGYQGAQHARNVSAGQPFPRHYSTGTTLPNTLTSLSQGYRGSLNV